MERTTLGTSDVEVSSIVFGAWAIGGWMWGGTDEGQSVAAIRRAIDLGVSSIDTAAIYGYGRSEKLVARALAELPRENVEILTKFGLRWDREEGQRYFTWSDAEHGTRDIYRNARRDSIIEECDASLRRLGTDYIDLYQCHRRDPTTPLEEMMEAFDRLLDAGKIRAAGVSNFTVDDLAACLKMGPIASIQPPYSMVNPGIEHDLLPYCRQHTVGVLAYSPLQRGLLTGKIEPDQTFAAGDHRARDPFFRPQNVRRVNDFLEGLQPVAGAHGITLAQLVIAWTVQQAGVTAALVGARDPRQAEENAGAAGVSLDPAELQRIDDLRRRIELDLS